MLKHVARVRQELYDRGIEKRLVKKKTEKRMRKVFFFPFDAAWVPGFRRSVTFKHPCLIVKQLRKQKLQRERELQLGGGAQIDTQQVKEEKVEVDLLNMTDVALIKYFAPHEEIRKLNFNLLNKEKWEKVLSNILTLPMKKIFLKKGPYEVFPMPYSLDKTQRELLIWQVLKNALYVDFFVPPPPRQELFQDKNQKKRLIQLQKAEFLNPLSDMQDQLEYWFKFRSVTLLFCYFTSYSQDRWIVRLGLDKLDEELLTEQDDRRIQEEIKQDNLEEDQEALGLDGQADQPEGQQDNKNTQNVVIAQTDQKTQNGINLQNLNIPKLQEVTKQNSMQSIQEESVNDSSPTSPRQPLSSHRRRESQFVRVPRKEGTRKYSIVLPSDTQLKLITEQKEKEKQLQAQNALQSQTSIPEQKKNPGFINTHQVDLSEAQIAMILQHLRKYGIVLINRLSLHLFMHRRIFQQHEGLLKKVSYDEKIGDNFCRLLQCFIVPTQALLEYNSPFKGCFVQVYQEKFVGCLQDYLSNRQTLDLPFFQSELLDFLQSNIEMLQRLDKKYGLYHGCLTPRNYIICGQDITQYKLLETAMMFVFDKTEDKIYFTRHPSQLDNNPEYLYLAPEIMRYSQYGFFLTQRAQKTGFSANAADIYALGVILLQMMTLGKFENECIERTWTLSEFISTSPCSSTMKTEFKDLYPIVQLMVNEVAVERPNFAKILFMLRKLSKYPLQEPEHVILEQMHHYHSYHTVNPKNWMDLTRIGETYLRMHRYVQAVEFLAPQIDAMDIVQQNLSQIIEFKMRTYLAYSMALIALAQYPEAQRQLNELQRLQQIMLEEQRQQQLQEYQKDNQENQSYNSKNQINFRNILAKLKCKTQYLELLIDFLQNPDKSENSDTFNTVIFVERINELKTRQRQLLEGGDGSLTDAQALATTCLLEVITVMDSGLYDDAQDDQIFNALALVSYIKGRYVVEGEGVSDIAMQFDLQLRLCKIENLINQMQFKLALNDIKTLLYTPDFENCVFNIKQQFLIKITQVDIFLKLDEADLFNDAFNTFKKSFALIAKKDSCFAFFIDIFDRFVHLYYFDQERENSVGKFIKLLQAIREPLSTDNQHFAAMLDLIAQVNVQQQQHSKNQSSANSKSQKEARKAEQRNMKAVRKMYQSFRMRENFLSHYTLGLLQFLGSDSFEKKNIAKGLLFTCLNSFLLAQELPEPTPHNFKRFLHSSTALKQIFTFKELNFVLVRTVELLFYSMKICLESDQLILMLQELPIQDKMGIVNLQNERIAKMLFYSEKYVDCVEYIQKIQIYVEENIEVDELPEFMLDQLTLLTIQCQELQVWCTFSIGQVRPAIDLLLQCFTDKLNTESSVILNRSVNLCILMIFSYRFYGLFESAKYVALLLISNLEKIRGSSAANEAQFQNLEDDMHTMLALVNLEHSKLGPLKQRYDETKYIEYLTYAEEHLLSVVKSPKITKYNLVTIQEVLGWIYEEECVTIKAYKYYVAIVPSRMVLPLALLPPALRQQQQQPQQNLKNSQMPQTASKQTEALLANLETNYDVPRLQLACKIALILVQLGCFHDAQLILSQIIDYCVTFRTKNQVVSADTDKTKKEHKRGKSNFSSSSKKLKHAQKEDAQMKRMLESIHQLELFCKCKLLEVLINTGQLKNLEEIYIELNDKYKALKQQQIIEDKRYQKELLSNKPLSAFVIYYKILLRTITALQLALGIYKSFFQEFFASKALFQLALQNIDTIAKIDRKNMIETDIRENPLLKEQDDQDVIQQNNSVVPAQQQQVKQDVDLLAKKDSSNSNNSQQVIQQQQQTQTQMMLAAKAGSSRFIQQNIKPSQESIQVSQNSSETNLQLIAEESKQLQRRAILRRTSIMEQEKLQTIQTKYDNDNDEDKPIEEKVQQPEEDEQEQIIEQPKDISQMNTFQRRLTYHRTITIHEENEEEHKEADAQPKSQQQQEYEQQLQQSANTDDQVKKLVGIKEEKLGEGEDKIMTQTNEQNNKENSNSSSQINEESSKGSQDSEKDSDVSENIDPESPIGKLKEGFQNFQKQTQDKLNEKKKQKQLEQEQSKQNPTQQIQQQQQQQSQFQDQENPPADLTEDLINLQQWRMELLCLQVENARNFKKNLIEQYLNMNQLQEQIVNCKSARSLYYAHFLRIRALIAFEIIQQKQIDTLIIFWRKKQLDQGKKITVRDNRDDGITEHSLMLNIAADLKAAKKMYKTFFKFENYDFSQHTLIAQCNTIMAYCDIMQKRTFKAKKHLFRAEVIYQQILQYNPHTDFIHLLVHQEHIQYRSKIMTFENVYTVLQLRDDMFNSFEKEHVIKQLLRENADFIKIFDEYRQIGFDVFLINNLRKYNESKNMYLWKMAKRKNKKQLDKNNPQQKSSGSQNINICLLDYIDLLQKKALTPDFFLDIIRVAQDEIRKEDSIAQWGLDIKSQQEQRIEYLYNALLQCNLIFKNSKNDLVYLVQNRIADAENEQQTIIVEINKIVNKGYIELF